MSAPIDACLGAVNVAMWRDLQLRRRVIATTSQCCVGNRNHARPKHRSDKMSIRNLRLNGIDLKGGEHLHNPYPEGFEPLNIKAGKRGPWSINKFKVTAEGVGMFNLRLIRDGFPQRIIPPGSYTRLVYAPAGEKPVIMMSDTPAEAHEHEAAYKAAKGKVLVTGLGLGFYLTAILRKPEVKSVTVVEQSKDVIALVGKHITDPRVTIIEGDAKEWRPRRGHVYDFIWHDIWPGIEDENKPEMLAMKKAYAKFGKKQACWSEEYL